MQLKNYLASSAALASAAAFFVAASPAHAAITCAPSGAVGPYQCFTSEDGDESKLFTIKADNTMAFFSQVGGNGTVQDIMSTTNVNVNTSNGYGEVKPSKGSGDWTSITFTPVDGSLVAWDGLFIRGQIDDTTPKTPTTIDISVTGVDGSTASFVVSGVKSDFGDFKHLGVDEPAGSAGVAIASITFSLPSDENFKSLKQFDVSSCLAADGCVGGGGNPPPFMVPEPSTWAMMALGFAGLGFAGYRKSKSRLAFAA